MPPRELLATLRRLRLVAVAGALLACYLTYLHLSPGHSSFCEIGPKVISCEAVSKSKYSELLGVPVSMFGICWFLLLLYFAFQAPLESEQQGIMLRLQLAWTLLGLLFVAYLLYAELMIGAICPLCTLIHVLNVLSAILARRALLQGGKQTGWLQAVRAVPRRLVLGSAVLFMLPLLVVHGSTLLRGNETAINPEHLLLCLRQKGVTMYGAASCGTCQAQKAVIGAEHFHLVDFADCELDRASRCEGRALTGYPTWIQGRGDTELVRVAGLLSLRQLSATFGCPLAPIAPRAP
jgi:uncharacterized membrane protein